MHGLAGSTRATRIITESGGVIPIEFDMTQDNANHIHSVWRDVKRDLGDDVLKTHYLESPR